MSERLPTHCQAVRPRCSGTSKTISIRRPSQHLRHAGRGNAQMSDAYRLPHCMSKHQERADKPILSVESGGPADVALMASALVRWLCVTGFSRVCPSIFLSIGSVWNRRIHLIKSTTDVVDGVGRSASASGSGCYCVMGFGRSAEVFQRDRVSF